MKRLYVYRKALFWNYKIVDTFFQNGYFNEQEWFIREEWFFRIGFDDQWFRIENMYYDGHTLKGFTFFKIEVGLGYGYDSRPVVDWEPEELPKEKA